MQFVEDNASAIAASLNGKRAQFAETDPEDNAPVGEYETVTSMHVLPWGAEDYASLQFVLENGKAFTLVFGGLKDRRAGSSMFRDPLAGHSTLRDVRFEPTRRKANT